MLEKLAKSNAVELQRTQERHSTLGADSILIFDGSFRLWHRRERAMTSWITLYLQGSGRSAMPCKEQMGTLRRIFWLYRSCTASFVGVSLNSLTQ